MKKRLNRHRSLTTEEVYNIVHMIIKSKLQLKEIAERLDVHYHHVTHIKTGKSYRDIVTESMLLNMNKGKLTTRRHLSEEEIEGIKDMLLSKKHRQKDIAALFKVDPSTITRIKKSMVI